MPRSAKFFTEFISIYHRKLGEGHTPGEAYRRAELQWQMRYGDRCYKNNNTFRRCCHYHIKQKER